MIVCCGEALIDMLQRTGDKGQTLYEPVVGGAVFNTAKALGRLGAASAYLGCLSTDAFGDSLRAALDDATVSYQLCPRSELPTALALVSLINGSASYSFHFAETAGNSLDVGSLPAIPDDVTGMHFGGISLIAEPCGSAYEALCIRESGQRLISIDPNIRPVFVTDEAKYRARLNHMLAAAHIVKVSDEDLEWLNPEASVEVFAKGLLQGSAELVVVTRGGQSALVFSKQHTLTVDAMAAEVVDTVGAGDTFVAGLWAGLVSAGLDTRESLANADELAISQAVSYAQKAASLSVSRAGADSPWLSEMG